MQRPVVAVRTCTDLSLTFGADLFPLEPEPRDLDSPTATGCAVSGDTPASAAVWLLVLGVLMRRAKKRA